MESFELEDEDPYYPQTKPKFLSKWMSKVNPITRLKDMIIPGSHKANSMYIQKPVFAVPFTKCQVESVTSQLERGIRFLDLRYGVVSNSTKKTILKMDLTEQEMFEKMIIDFHGNCKGIFNFIKK